MQIDGDLLEKTGASFKRGKSKQNYATPADFRDAVLKRFGRIEYDLAADRDNVFASGANCYYDETEDSLKQPWSQLSGILWLNPPFGNIAPWAKKCFQERLLGARILFLVPASVGSNWFAEYVDGHALVHFLRPRICFDGKDPFPKDCMLCEFGGTSGYCCWKWK